MLMEPNFMLNIFNPYDGSLTLKTVKNLPRCYQCQVEFGRLNVHVSFPEAVFLYFDFCALKLMPGH